MENKAKELGVFTIGLGMIGALLVLYVVLVIADSANGGGAVQLSLMLIPSLVFIVTGSLVLAVPRRTIVKVAATLLTLALIADALIWFHPIKCIISFGAGCLVWKTAREAMEQLPY